MIGLQVGTNNYTAIIIKSNNTNINNGRGATVQQTLTDSNYFACKLSFESNFPWPTCVFTLQQITGKIIGSFAQ